MRNMIKIVVISLALLTVVSAQAKDKLNIVFTHHSSASNTFWQGVKAGFDDACGKIEARCQMLFTQTEGSIEQQFANFEAAIARRPDAILTTIVDNKALDAIIQRAIDKGITVIGVNVDDIEGALGNARQAFIGQSFVRAGYALAQAMSVHFPAKGPIKSLVGISAPGQNWSEQRGEGVIKFLQEYKDNNPGRDVSWKRIDSGTDLAITADRVGAYLTANPDTIAYFDTGFWNAGVGRVLEDRNIAAGKILLGGFDLVPEVVRLMKNGYIQVQVDQQPYTQGFMPVMMVYLEHNFGLSPSDINTGRGLIDINKH